MQFMVPVAVLCVALSVPYSVTANRRPGLARTTVSVIFVVLFAMFAWTHWLEWRNASGAVSVQHAIAFWCYCATFAMCMIALGRRIVWIMQHRRDA